MVSITNARAIAQLASVKAACDAGSGPAIIRVYSGTVPTNLDTALTGQTLLAQLTMNAVSFADPVDANPNATMTANAITDDSSADASGTPTFTRIFDSDINPVLQTTAGVGSGEANFAAAIVSGAPVTITSCVVTQPE